MAPRPFWRDRAGQITGFERGFRRADGIAFLKYMWTALPDFSVDIKQMIGEGTWWPGPADG